MVSSRPDTNHAGSRVSPRRRVDEPNRDCHAETARHLDDDIRKLQQDGFASADSCRYSNLNCIAAGGMGTIYRAYDCQLDREVALKVLSVEPDSETAIQRFVTESRVLAQLQHPGIPPVYDVGRLPDGRAFIAMKLVEGHSLGYLLSVRETPMSDVVRFLGTFRQICETVAFAHANGVLHRDLKPANVMVGTFGEIQVIDWGIAKRRGTADGDSPTLEIGDGASDVPLIRSGQTAGIEPQELTVAGGPLGTPGYMPPEQARGRHEEVCEASDIYSLGCILHEILTGQPPSQIADVLEQLDSPRSAFLEELKIQLTFCPADAVLKQLVIQCLQPEPHERPQSAGEIVALLDADLSSMQNRLWEMELDQTKEREQRRRRRMISAFAVCASLLLALIAGGWAVVANQRANRQRSAVESVSRALGEAEQLRATALRSPLQDAQLWTAAENALRRADAVARQAGDERLTLRVAELRDEIQTQSAQAARDRRLVAQLENADGPVPLEDVRNRMLKLSQSSQQRRNLEREQGLLDDPRHSGNSGQNVPDAAVQAVESAVPQLNNHKLGQELIACDRFLAAMTEYGLNPRKVAAADAVIRLSRRPSIVRNAVGTALDRWLAILVENRGDERVDVAWVVKFQSGIDANESRNTARALISDGHGQFANVVVEHPKLLEHPPSFIWLIARQLTDRNAATEVIRKARDRYPESRLLNRELAIQYERQGDIDNAIGAFMAALAIQQDAHTYARVARLQFHAGRVDEAVALCRHAIRIDPVSSDVYPALAKTLLAAGRLKQVGKAVAEGLKIVPKESHQRRILLLTLGKAQGHLGEDEAALATFQKLNADRKLPVLMRNDVQRRIENLERQLANKE